MLLQNMFAREHRGVLKAGSPLIARRAGSAMVRRGTRARSCPMPDCAPAWRREGESKRVPVSARRRASRRARCRGGRRGRPPNAEPRALEQMKSASRSSRRPAGRVCHEAMLTMKPSASDRREDAAQIDATVREPNRLQAHGRSALRSNGAFEQIPTEGALWRHQPLRSIA